MLKQKDLIKHSGIIEYLEQRLKKVEKEIDKLNSRKIWVIDETQREWDNLCGRKEELDEMLSHFKGEINNED